MKHGRILDFPYADSLLGARLDGLYEETHRRGRDLIVDYHELCLDIPPVLSSLNEQPVEQVQGRYVPRRLRFGGLRWVKATGLYNQPDALPLDHAARSLRGMLHWRTPDQEALYLLFNGSDGQADLLFSARHCMQEYRTGPDVTAAFTRDWAPPPPLPSRLVPNPVVLYRRNGGDPISIRLGKRAFHRRLFVGGLDCQSDMRPEVDAILNLGEDPSRWATCSQSQLSDRWAQKGEGQGGMSAAEIAEEAGWVIDRLRVGQKVLVHCSAGLNRSVTVCCGVLIRLEGLSAETALERVREHHPWARPDARHWLALRWLAHVELC